MGRKGACPQNAEHVSEVGTGSHADVLEYVGEDFSPLDDTPFEHHQVLLQQDQIGRLLGDVGCSIHRDPNVRGAQRGRIVDSVSHESHNVPLAAQDANDSLLVGGREAGEEGCLFRSLGQFGVRHFLHVVAQQHRVGEESHVPANFAANQVVVTGEYLYRNTMFAQRFNCGRGGGFGRVEECDISL